MSKNKTPKKKVITTKKEEDTTSKRRVATSSRRNRSTAPPRSTEMIFDKENYILMGVGIVVIALGLLLMAGGGMPEPDVWEPERIYSFRRTTLAPIVIIIGLVIEIFAIFKKK